MREKKKFAEFDWWLMSIVGVISLLGLLEIYSATHNSNMAGMQWKQMIWIVVGIVGMLILTRMNYHTLLDQAPVLYLLGLLALLAVLVMGHTRFGARRWVEVGGIFLQVSELMKLIIIIVLARFFSEVRTDKLALQDLCKAGILVAVPALLILMEPDLGTALALIPVALVGVYLAGMEGKHVAVLLAIVLLLMPIAWHLRSHLKPYQQQRIETFLHPEESPRGAGYQILQSEIAVGSGGLWGKGFGKGSQNQLGFVPVRYSDFILAAFAEEFGFAGVLLTLSLYMMLVLRLVESAQKAKDRAGMFLVMGVAAILVFHVLVNAAMVTGHMPVTGIPLPLMSYGGSSTAFVFLALGLVMNVRMTRFVN
jgi:rod shape determining protein RodA